MLPCRYSLAVKSQLRRRTVEAPRLCRLSVLFGWLLPLERANSLTRALRRRCARRPLLRPRYEFTMMAFFFSHHDSTWWRKFLRGHGSGSFAGHQISSNSEIRFSQPTSPCHPSLSSLFPETRRTINEVECTGSGLLATAGSCVRRERRFGSLTHACAAVLPCIPSHRRRR